MEMCTYMRISLPGTIRVPVLTLTAHGIHRMATPPVLGKPQCTMTFSSLVTLSSKKQSAFNIQGCCPSSSMLTLLMSSQFSAQNGQRAHENHQLLPRHCSAPFSMDIEFPGSFHPVYLLAQTINPVWCP